MTPFSVIIAVIFLLGVTSKAGFPTSIPSGAIFTPLISVTSLESLSSIGIESPVTIAQLAKIREDFMRVLTGAHHGRIDYPEAAGGITADYEPASSPGS